MNPINIDKFLSGYISCALWAEGDYRDEEGTEHYQFDDEFSDVSDKCREAMLSDCKDFIDSNFEDIVAFKEYANCDDWRLGLLFWLNRNGHGSGFWDELPSSSDGHDVSDKLADASNVYGTFDLYGDFDMGVVRSHHYG